MDDATAQALRDRLTHFSERKLWELRELVRIIRAASEHVEMILLFGSHARGDWVEELAPDGIHYQYRSDYDLLVVVNKRLSDHAQDHLESDIGTHIYDDRRLRTPVSPIVHDIDFVNRHLRKGQYFFSDIKREGVVLYDTGRYTLDEARELSPRERAHLALEDYEQWLTLAEEFYDQFLFALEKQSQKMSAFLLHQVTERLYCTLLLVYSRYKPNTHDLEELRRYANAQETRLLPVFPNADEEDIHRFELLRRAYVEARYKPIYRITPEELDWLRERVELLSDLTMQLCTEKIESFTQAPPS